MSKTLKICLAMGGGVSLGSFSGSALTEALKLLVLFGKDKKGNLYDKIVVDGMSGASAGAIALVIMLKTLIDYKKMMKVFNAYLTSDERRKTLGKMATPEIDEHSLLLDIAKDYFNGDFDKIPTDYGKRDMLIALQLAQKVQHQIWVERLNSNELFGNKIEENSKVSPHDSFGLLDRGLLKKLAKYYILSIDDLTLDNIQVLDKRRVILACSLTNMLPIEINLGENSNLSVLDQNALKSTGSQNHTELRVIDFVFDNEVQKTKPTDDTWFKISHENGSEMSGDEKKESQRNTKMDLDIYGEEAWSKITATALACGAFPIAFEPVVLKRYKEEFNDIDGVKGNISSWPLAFKSIQGQYAHVEHLRRKSFFNEKGDNYIDYNSFNFPYIDGGTFNNEPIREAFRIASFQDYGTENSGDFDRLILFVDPAVRNEKYSAFTVGSFKALDEKDGKITYNSEFSKFWGNVGSTIGVLANQGSIKEEHRIKDARENMVLRDVMYSFINEDQEDEDENLAKALNIPMVKATFAKIHNNLKQGNIPIGTRSAVDYFMNALKERCVEIGSHNIDLDKDTLEDIEAKLAAGDTNLTIEKIFEMLNSGIEDEKEKLHRKKVFSQTVFRMMIDFSLRTAGKNEKAEKMSILPIAKETLNTIELPGHEVAAFSGFASLPSREYAFDYGRLSTLISLKENGIDNSSLGKYENRGYRNSIKNETAIVSDSSLEEISNGLVEKLKNHKFYNKDYKFDKDLHQNLYVQSLDRVLKVAPLPKFVTYLIKKTPPSWITGGASISFFVALVKNISYLTSFTSRGYFRKQLETTAEEIGHRKLLPVTISIISSKRIPKRVKLTKGDGKKVIIRMKRLPYPNNRHQYLFQLHYLEYLKKDSENQNFVMQQQESVTINKTSADQVERIGLTHKTKVKNPSTDSNLNYNEWRNQLENESNKIELTEIKIRNKKISNIFEDINNKDFSLFYSLSNINYHVNPMIEYDLDKKTEPKNTWHFKDNTKALFIELLEEDN